MTTDPNSAAFVTTKENYLQKGLTKREYFANSALQGLLSIFDAQNSLVPNYDNTKYMVQLAVKAADKLIEELNKEK